jgi:hypothetical protein
MVGIRPVNNIVQINNNRKPRGFNSYHTAKVHHISEIRYASKMGKYITDQPVKLSLVKVLKICLTIIKSCLKVLRPYLQIIAFFGFFLILGGLLAELVVR